MRDYNGRCAQCGLWNCHHLYTTSNTANGPQTERSGVPNPEPDGLVTVELTREEAEVLLLGDHVVDCEAELTALSDSATAKIRASLERTGK